MNADRIKRLILAKLHLVNRDGMEELIKWLEESDYFVAPASAKFHLNIPTGLMRHCWSVYLLFKEQNIRLQLDLSDDSVVICSFLHDLCKVGLYKLKDNKYVYDGETLNRGHALLSLDRIRKFIQLSREEETIIRFHMGLWHEKSIVTYGEYTIKQLKEAYIEFPSVRFFHHCDEASSKIEEVR